MKKIMVIVAMTIACIGSITAQTTDKRLLGVWVMESMKFEGEDKIICGKESGYTQLKYYGPDGEYVCAQIVRHGDDKYVILPHEYGTYTYKDGAYTEMGREPIPNGITWVNDTTTKGRWGKRHDVWKKQTKMPQKMVEYIVNYCKMIKQGPTPEMQKLIKEHMFSN